MTIRKSVVVLGPTASGKSDAAMTAAALQPKGSVHVIAADSMQVYKRMDIGTAKPSAADQALITHHCLDVAEPSERYTVARYMEDVAVARATIAEAGAAELVVGGTGLYVTAIVDGLDMPGEFPEIRAELEANEDTEALFAQLLALDPEATTKMEPNNRRRIIRALEVCTVAGVPYSSLRKANGIERNFTVEKIGLEMPRAQLYDRINQRVYQMVQMGLEEEVKALHPQFHLNALQTVGYQEWLPYLEGNQSKEAVVQAIQQNTRHYAKRQMTWFKKDPEIKWQQASE
jgi:tRNA dimethylallyltransferase